MAPQLCVESKEYSGGLAAQQSDFQKSKARIGPKSFHQKIMVAKWYDLLMQNGASTVHGPQGVFWIVGSLTEQFQSWDSPYRIFAKRNIQNGCWSDLRGFPDDVWILGCAFWNQISQEPPLHSVQCTHVFHVFPKIKNLLFLHQNTHKETPLNSFLSTLNSFKFTCLSFHSKCKQIY